MFIICIYLFLEIGSGHKGKSIEHLFINLLGLMVNHHLVFLSKVIFSLIQLAVFQDFQFSSLCLFLWPFCGIQRRYVEMVPVCDDQS